MKNFLKTEFVWPIVVLLAGVIVPSTWVALVPEQRIFDGDLLYLYGIAITLSCTLTAVKITFNRVIAINPDTRAENIFEFEEERQSEAALLKAQATTAELVILGVTLLSLVTSESPNDLAELLLFASLRIGGVLFLLGGMVMAITHVKMRKL